MWQIFESNERLSDIPIVLKSCGPRRGNCSVDRIPSSEANSFLRFEVQGVLLLRIRVLCDVTLCAVPHVGKVRDVVVAFLGAK